MTLSDKAKALFDSKALGMLGLKYDPEWGGAGLDWSYTAVMFDEIGRCDNAGVFPVLREERAGRGTGLGAYRDPCGLRELQPSAHPVLRRDAHPHELLGRRRREPGPDGSQSSTSPKALPVPANGNREKKGRD